MLCIREAVLEKLAAIKVLECPRCMHRKPPREVSWAESGVHSRDDAQRVTQPWADAVLVWSELMERPERLVELNR